MKKLITGSLLLILCTVASVLVAQNTSLPSPPANAKGTINGATISINYHSTAVKGRDVWNKNGKLAPYGKLWRTGANNATTFETDQDLLIENNLLPAGKYALFSVPNDTEWEIIFNKVWDQWGTYDYSKKEDFLRVKIKPNNANPSTERFTIEVAEQKVNLLWANVMASFIVKTKN
jgi:hypothetical protein